MEFYIHNGDLDCSVHMKLPSNIHPCRDVTELQIKAQITIIPGVVLTKGGGQARLHGSQPAPDCGCGCGQVVG